MYDLVDEPQNEIYISVVSIWEIALKQNIGKLILNYPFVELIETINTDEYIYLPIKDDYIKIYKELPLMKKHNDPYDRMLISTAMSENLKFITADKDIHKYKQIECIWKKK